jgi:hypothetical protein
MFALNMNFGVVGRKIESVGVIEDIWSWREQCQEQEPWLSNHPFIEYLQCPRYACGP